MLTFIPPFRCANIHPPPVFGSSPNLEALALEANKSQDHNWNSTVNFQAQFSRYNAKIYSCYFVSLTLTMAPFDACEEVESMCTEFYAKMLGQFFPLACLSLLCSFLEGEQNA